MKGRSVRIIAAITGSVLLVGAATGQSTQRGGRTGVSPEPVQAVEARTLHREAAVPPPSPTAPLRPLTVAAAMDWVRDGFVSVQVNIDAQGNNVVGDAGNEPSIATDPTNPGTFIIGWRQFDTTFSDFRQSGVAYSHDNGQTWTNPGVLEPGEFSSDPVLAYDADGRIYYYALQPNRGPGAWACYMYRTEDRGVTWPLEVYAFGGDKAWVTVDRTNGVGRGNIYVPWTPNAGAGCCFPGVFTRSTDHGATWMTPIAMPVPQFSSTVSVGVDGSVYVVGSTFAALPTFNIIRSSNAQDAGEFPTWDLVREVDLDGVRALGAGPNPAGLIGQAWVGTDHSNGSTRGNVYVLSTVQRLSVTDPADVMFTRSTDGGETWSDPIRVNDDPLGNGAWQWFGTMGVAPNGRIDVIFNDTRADPTVTFSELYYTSSSDGGVTWTPNIPVSPAFNHFLGYPQQNKLGDYYDIISDNTGASVAYAATFNGEQDVYYLRIRAADCNGNGLPDDEDVTEGRSEDCDADLIPDECALDCDDDGTPDTCEVLDGAPDCNDNRTPDDCEPDFDGDLLIDGCDPDIDNDGVPNESDICDRTPLGRPVHVQGVVRGHVRGDFEANCVVNLADALALANCTLEGGGPLFPAQRLCSTGFDINLDSFVDLRDVALFMNVFDEISGATAAATADR